MSKKSSKRLRTKKLSPNSLIIVLVLLSIPLTVILSQKVHEIRQRAQLAGVLADTPWPIAGQNQEYTYQSHYVGPHATPLEKWKFNRTSDHWGTNYRSTGIGRDNTVYLAAGMTGVYAIDSQTGLKKWLFIPENTGHETWIEYTPTVTLINPYI